MDKLIEALTLLRETIDGVGRATAETADNPKWRYHRDTPHMKKMAVIYAEWAAAVQVIIDNLPALSHAAEQEGEQCRAASGEPDAWLYEYEHDGESDHCLSRVRFLPSWVEAKRATENPLYLRALSRGVPEGDSSDPERYRILRDWFLRGGKLSEILPAGHVKRYSEAEFDVEIDRIRAIAAQRKEG